MPWWSYHWGQLFSQQNQPWPSMLDSSIIPAAHQKLAFIKWHYLHERQLPNNLSPILPFNLQSRVCKIRGEERKDTEEKRTEIVVSATEANIPPACRHPFFFPLLKVKPPPPLFCNVLGGVRNSMCKLVTKQHTHTFFSTGSFLVSLADRKVNDRLIILVFLGKTLTPELPLYDSLLSILDEGLPFFSEIFWHGFHFLHTLCMTTQPTVPSIGDQLLPASRLKDSHGAMGAYDGNHTN